MTDNNSVIPRSSGKSTAITDMMFDIANDSTLGNGSQRQDITDHKIGLLPTENELTGIHTLCSYEQLLLMLVTERVPECHPGKRSSTTRVMDNLGDHAFQIPISLAEIEAPESGGSFAVVSVGLEYTPCSLTLCPDNPTH